MIRLGYYGSRDRNTFSGYSRALACRDSRRQSVLNLAQNHYGDKMSSHKFSKIFCKKEKNKKKNSQIFSSRTKIIFHFTSSLRAVVNSPLRRLKGVSDRTDVLAVATTLKSLYILSVAFSPHSVRTILFPRE